MAARILGEIVERLGAMVFSTAAVLANMLPRPLRETIGALFAAIHYGLSPRKRRAVRENLAGAGALPRRGLVFGVFRIHTLNILEMIAASRWKAGKLSGRFEFEGRETLDDALRENRGVVLATQHIGAWETAAVYLSGLGYRLHVVAGVQLSRLLTGEVRRAKERLGIEVINPEDSSRKLLKALAGGGVLALLLDGNVYTGGTEIVFFGKRTILPEGPVRLARAAGAPIVAGYCRRCAGGRYRIRMESVCGGEEVRAMSEGEALARVYGAIERYIRDNADQWIMFRRFWENAR